MKDLKNHWIGTYNREMSSSYDNSKGDLLMKLLYLSNYAKSIDAAKIRQEQTDKIEKIGKELIETRNNISDNVKGIVNNVYSAKYARDNHDKMPFYHYIEELSQINKLLTDCKRLLAEELDSISVLCIVESIICRISEITHSAEHLSKQIYGLLISLNNKKLYIESNYQSPLDTIYKDSLASMLIGLGEQKVQGQKPYYNSGWCWTEYVKFIRTKNEIQNIFDAKIRAIDEDVLREKDIQDYNNYLQSALTQPYFKNKVESALATCKDCKIKADEYNQIYGYIDELLKFDEQ